MKLNMGQWALIVLCNLLVLTGCSESPTTTSKTASKPGITQTPLPEPAPAKAAWPFAKGEEPSVDLADNFLTKNYFLVFDGSGSMRESNCSGARQKIEVAKEVVAQWAQGIGPEANLGLIAFHNSGVTSLPLTAGSRENFIDTINKIPAGGGTPLAEAAAYAYESCTKQAKRQLGYGEYTIVVVTDGIADDRTKLKKTIENILTQSPVNIYSIGFCIGANHALNQPGRTIYKAANNPDELRQGLQEVLAESETFDDSDFSK
jgi:uncharacterized protein YegL